MHNQARRDEEDLLRFKARETACAPSSSGSRARRCRTAPAPGSSSPSRSRESSGSGAEACATDSFLVRTPLRASVRGSAAKGSAGGRLPSACAWAFDRSRRQPRPLFSRDRFRCTVGSQPQSAVLDKEMPAVNLAPGLRSRRALRARLRAPGFAPGVGPHRAHFNRRLRPSAAAGCRPGAASCPHRPPRLRADARRVTTEFAVLPKHRDHQLGIAPRHHAHKPHVGIRALALVGLAPAPRGSSPAPFRFCRQSRCHPDAPRRPCG